MKNKYNGKKRKWLIFFNLQHFAYIFLPFIFLFHVFFLSPLRLCLGTLRTEGEEKLNKGMPVEYYYKTLEKGSDLEK